MSTKTLTNAIRNRDVETVKELLNDPNIDIIARGNYYILTASLYGYTEIVELLLQDPRVYTYDNIHQTIGFAAKNGHVETVKMLLKNDKLDPSYNNNYAIRLAAERGHTEVVKTLLQDSRVDPSAVNNYAIRKAAKNGHIEIVKILLQDGRADPSAQDNYAIRWASENGHIGVVKLLLQDERIDPAARNNYAIRLASYLNRTEVVKILLQDPRVDWRVIKYNPIVQDLLNQQDEQMRNQYITSYLSLKKETTRTLDLGKTDEGQQTITKSLLEPAMLQQLSYRSLYEELCSAIPTKIPPMKLIALANALKIEYNFHNINWTELCAKVKTKLNLVIFN